MTFPRNNILKFVSNLCLIMPIINALSRSSYQMIKLSRPVQLRMLTLSNCYPRPSTPFYATRAQFSLDSSNIDSPPAPSAEEVDSADITSVDIMNFELPSNAKNPNLLKIRHTTAHVMAMAVQKIFPDIKVTIGPWIENGYVGGFHCRPLNFFLLHV